MATSYAGMGSFSKDRMDGVGTFPGGIFENLDINGVYTSEGSLEAARLDIDGVFTNRGDIKAETLDCDGVATIEGNLRAKVIDIDGVVTIHGDKLEADQIKCDGVLTVHGQVSADGIDAGGFINAREIVGDRIVIKSFRKSFFFRAFLKFKELASRPDFSKVDLIEATTIELEGVRAKSVNGQDIIIGPRCVIDHLDCSGTLHIDPEAEVKEITGAAARS